MANRLVDAARGELRRVLDDIFISTDHTRSPADAPRHALRRV
jgi:hypothetical protein